MSTDPASTDFDTVLQRAELLLDMGRAQQAKEVLLPLLGSQAPQALVYALLARAALLLDAPAECLEWASSGLNVDPGNVALLIWLVVALIAEGRSAEAMEPAQHALALAPGVWATHYYLGLALDGTGRPKDAAQCMETVLQLDPGNEFALGWRARHHTRTAHTALPFQSDRRLREVRHDATAILRMSPDSAEGHLLLGLGHGRHVNLRGMGRELSEAALLSPQESRYTDVFGVMVRGMLRRLTGGFSVVCFILAVLRTLGSSHMSTYGHLALTVSVIVLMVQLVTLWLGASAAGRAQLMRAAFSWPMVLITAVGLSGVVVAVVATWIVVPALLLFVYAGALACSWIALRIDKRRGAKNRR